MPSSSDIPTSLRDERYAVIGLLAEGSQGATLDAVDKRDGRPVAIKRFQVKGARSWKDVELAEREARVLRRLSHPALPEHVEHFEEDGALRLEGVYYRQWPARYYSTTRAASSMRR